MSELKEDLKTGLKTIENFLKKDLTLIIPNYQRGYRWTKTQIEKLLEDLYDFGDKKYSLQPITLKKVDDKKYRVIDGQQRLTTICLILDNYEENSSLQKNIKPKNKEEWEGLDKKFIINANEIIKSWKKDNKEEDRKKVVKILKNAEILIYLLEGNETSKIDEIEFFSKINSGKIALTDSEIIKALFVKILSSEQERKRFLKQWEDIENDLQDDKFWLFISNDKDKTDTRIDFLFRLLKEAEEKGKFENIEETKNSQYSLFLVYEDYLKKHEEKVKEVENLWQGIRRYYSILKYLQNDIECYHLFGYLMSVDEKLAKNCLTELYRISKSQATGKIQNKIKEHLIISFFISFKRKFEPFHISGSYCVEKQ